MSIGSAGSESLFPLVAVVGPTASGKSALALDIAERFGGEIVNFDAVQVYRHFDIGTAKTLPQERRDIPHHLLDILEPDALFTAGDYAERARPVLAGIRRSSQLLVLVGGTGFYLRALLDGLFQGPKRNETLRRRLDRRAQSKPAGYLHRILMRLDAESAVRIHANDAPKLIRAIEVTLLARIPMSALWRTETERLEGYEVIHVGLDPPRDVLYAGIERRAERMFRAGLVGETQRLLASGIPRSARPFGSLGYSQALDYLDGKITREEAIVITSRRTRRYAKRQMTWFRRNPDTRWFHGFGSDNVIRNQVLTYVEGCLGAYPLRLCRKSLSQYGEKPI